MCRALSSFFFGCTWPGLANLQKRMGQYCASARGAAFAHRTFVSAKSREGQLQHFHWCTCNAKRRHFTSSIVASCGCTPSAPPSPAQPSTAQLGSAVRCGVSFTPEFHTQRTWPSTRPAQRGRIQSAAHADTCARIRIVLHAEQSRAEQSRGRGNTRSVDQLSSRILILAIVACT